MSKKKTFITGLGNYHLVGNGSGSGEPNQYLKSASVNQTNTSLTLIDKENNEIVFTPPIPSEITQYIKNASVSGNTLTLTKQDNTTIVYQLNTEAVNQLISDYLNQVFFTKLEQHLGSGFIIDDNNKLISVNNLPEPPKPTFTGIFSYDSQENKYRMYDHTTIFDSSQSIKYCLLDSNSSQPSLPISYSYTIERATFNEKIFINDSEGNFNGGVSGSSGFTQFLSNCQSFNQPLDLSNCNWTKIGHSFMKLCITFNSTIIFPSTIQTIGVEFMEGCSTFNNSIQSIMSPNLQKIEHSFLSQCINFNQDINIENTNIDTIQLDFFMYNCKMFASKQFYMTNKSVYIFKPYSYSDLQDIDKACATNDISAIIYTIGFHFSAHNLTKQDFDNFHIDYNGQAYYPLRNSSNLHYKKIVVNGIE